MQAITQKKPLILMILDGWGYRKDCSYNAIAAARTSQWDEWWATQPHMLLNASGHEVGLPDNQMGNSEVGHMHMGAGRVVFQDFTRINEAISLGEFNQNTLLLTVIEEMKARNKKLHVMGLLSPGGVHSHEKHLFAFLALCQAKGFANVCLHLFLDGRDTPPQSAINSINALEQCLTKYPVGKICSITGRYFAMDRDHRWERIEPVYRLLTESKSLYHFATPKEGILSFYKQNIYDEFIPPTIIGSENKIEDNDSLFFFNFRADRARQLTEALINPDFHGFERQRLPKLAYFISMTQYSKTLLTECVFPPLVLKNTFGEIISNHGLKQLRIAETEKYAHVTFFFNGGSEKAFPNEDRLLIPSPKVATYDLMPQMSAPELTAALVEAINKQSYDVIICNYANADMVGHSGNFDATVQAIEVLDKCMQQVWQALAPKGGALMITSDHGNAEIMFDETTKQIQTAHTNQLVPLIYVGGGWHFKATIGGLIDIAPTLLALLNIEKPEEMTGHSLLVKNHVQA